MTFDELEQVERQENRLRDSRESRRLIPEDQCSQLDTGYTGRVAGDYDDNVRRALRRPAEPPNPQTGEIWEHRDGGSIYVVERTKEHAVIQRRPFGDSQAEPQRVTLFRFRQQTTGRMQ